MFWSGFSLGCIVMALVAILAYEYFLHIERERVTNAEVEAEKYRLLYEQEWHRARA